MDYYQRNRKSNFNTALYMVYGGELWVRLLLCLGYVSQDVVDGVRAVIAARVRESATEPAPRRGRDPAAPPRGITHTTSRAKQLREVAKLEVRGLQEHRQPWWRAEPESGANACRRERC